MISIIITDNGIGREESEKRSGQYSIGEGITITEEIFQYLNQLYSKPSTIQIENLIQESSQYPGTKVTLKIYSKYQEEK